MSLSWDSDLAQASRLLLESNKAQGVLPEVRLRGRRETPAVQTPETSLLSGAVWESGVDPESLLLRKRASGTRAWMLPCGLELLGVVITGPRLPVLLGRGRLCTGDVALCSRRRPMPGILGAPFSHVLLKTLQ